MQPIKIINVTRRVRELLRQKADPIQFRETATECTDGTFDIPISEDTWKRISGCALPGETVSETLERIGMLDTTKNRLQ